NLTRPTISAAPSLDGVAHEAVEFIAIVEIEALHRVVVALHRSRVFALEIAAGERLELLVDFDSRRARLKVRSGCLGSIVAGRTVRAGLREASGQSPFLEQRRLGILWGGGWAGGARNTLEQS